MRRRARQMRHAAAAEPGEMIGDRLAGARQHQRRAADDRAQKYLQAAVAADVVERAPHDGAVETLSGADRRDQAGQAVHRHLRHAGRAGREQHPFGRHLRQRMLRQPGQWPARKRRAPEDRMPRGPACPRRSRRRRPRRRRSKRRDDRLRYRAAKSSSRRATPSSSISASAVVSWLDVATTTERPASSASRPPRLVPRAR